MSKGFSGLFHNTSGHKLYTNTLRDKAINAVEKLINSTPGGKQRAMAVGAYDIQTGKIVTSFATASPEKIHPELRKRADRIGGVGSHGVTDKNIVGICAEFHVINSLLNKGSKLENIRLTPAIQPRTGNQRAYCNNCQSMFYDIMSLGVFYNENN